MLLLIWPKSQTVSINRVQAHLLCCCWSWPKAQCPAHVWWGPQRPGSASWSRPLLVSHTRQSEPGTEQLPIVLLMTPIQELLAESTAPVRSAEVVIVIQHLTKLTWFSQCSFSSWCRILLSAQISIPRSDELAKEILLVTGGGGLFVFYSLVKCVQFHRQYQMIEMGWADPSGHSLPCLVCMKTPFSKTYRSMTRRNLTTSYHSSSKYQTSQDMASNPLPFQWLTLSSSPSNPRPPPPNPPPPPKKKNNNIKTPDHHLNTVFHNDSLPYKAQLQYSQCLFSSSSSFSYSSPWVTDKTDMWRNACSTQPLPAIAEQQLPGKSNC